MQRLKSFLREDRAQEIAEAAVVLPLTMMLLLGIYWFGRVYNIYGTIHPCRERGRPHRHRADVRNVWQCCHNSGSSGGQGRRHT